MVIITALSLLAAGMVNFFAGFLGLFPGLFELALGEPDDAPESVGVLELLGTSYGRYAIGHLVGAGLQLVAGSWLGVLTRGPLLHSLAALCVLCAGLEAWGWWLKGEFSAWALPGATASVLTGALYALELRRRRGG